MKKVAVLYPSSSGSKNDLEFGLDILKKEKLDVHYIEYDHTDCWPIYSADIKTRAKVLINLLEDTRHKHYLVC